MHKSKKHSNLWTLRQKDSAACPGKLTALVGLTADKIELKDIELEELKKHLEMIWQGRDDIFLTVENGSIRGDKDMLVMLIINLCDNAKRQVRQGLK